MARMLKNAWRSRIIREHEIDRKLDCGACMRLLLPAAVLLFSTTSLSHSFSFEMALHVYS